MAHTITMLPSCVDPLSFGYNMKRGRWVMKGEAWGDNYILRRLAKQMLMHLVSKHNSALILPRHTLSLRMTHSAALAKKGTAMCHQALTLQIARQAGPNYNNHTNRATRRPTWLEGASQSCLIYDAPQKPHVALLPNRLPMRGATIYNLQPPSPTACKGLLRYRVSSAPLIASHTGTQPRISVRAFTDA